MGKREQVATILGNPLAHRVWDSSGAGSRSLHILAYHRVLDDDHATFPFDEAVISATTHTFRQQMEFVSRNFNVISFKQLARLERERRAWPERALMITFDDGYRDNYTNAFPILREMGFSATIFLAVAHINAAKLFWWDFIAYCFKQTPLSSVTLSLFDAQPLSLADTGARREATDRVLDWIKEVSESTKSEFVSTLADNLEVRLPKNLAAGMHLSWDEVREMTAGGIEFGSHTMTHPILSNVNAEQLALEVSESKRIMEQELGSEVLTFSYPVGGRTSFNEMVKAEVQKCGFRYAVSYREGVAKKGCDPFALPRIHIETSHSLNLFRANLMYPKIMLR
jgi:peptidoglycan/xylan/chitin deacetylase (PgdA/CDA1 family)